MAINQQAREPETVTVRLAGLAHDEQATLEDRVLPDRTCGQYESGWWAYIAGDGADVEVFISDDGTVYDGETNDVVGKAPTVEQEYQRRIAREHAQEAGL